MEQNINALKAEVEAWAAEKGQEYVAIEISRMYFLLCERTVSAKLHPIEINGNANWKAINNNRQQIFRWLRSDSRAARRKVSELLPAIQSALPLERKARVNGETTNYLISVAIREFTAVIIAILLGGLGGSDVSQQITVAISALNALTNV
ncbi:MULTISPECIES: toxin YdaT family protein [Photorhabdus]|uniref:tRNA-(Guanine-N1)-methyltransferase n=1 Tax=Photorhabdus thracensis TaxID=230089 RepID=A0A0F7LPW8_9GAMM|nr:toxin YdaT family protein [Photorhabdus thracensis]AKH63872.1 tRNA-(guanine-N1)-methyltransferase [Photorhabdus thracensis]MBS9442998.1 tRNA-(guanine-N1)-methyltransferase [Photorhabdus heterorhabditis]PQQ35845.1 tRNA-(guanine-N1)-methyltransferase [Photorhabdus luminescens]